MIASKTFIQTAETPRIGRNCIHTQTEWLKTGHQWNSWRSEIPRFISLHLGKPTKSFDVKAIQRKLSTKVSLTRTSLNRLHSINHDSRFVREVAKCFPSYPVVGTCLNLWSLTKQTNAVDAGTFHSTSTTPQPTSSQQTGTMVTGLSTLAV